jgi:hypothetical protein
MGEPANEIHWAQKDRICWLQCGDRNTRFFHMTTIQRRSHNIIWFLKDGRQNKMDDTQALIEDFENRFKSGESTDIDLNETLITPTISEADNHLLSSHVSKNLESYDGNAPNECPWS